MANILDPMDLKQIITFHLDVLPHKFHASVVLICLFRPDSDCAFYQYFHQLGIRTFLTFACLRYVKVGIEPKIINIALPKSKSIKFVRGTCIAFMLTCVCFSIFDPRCYVLGSKIRFSTDDENSALLFLLDLSRTFRMSATKMPRMPLLITA